MTYYGEQTHNDDYSAGYVAGAKDKEAEIIKLLEHMPRTDDDRTVDAPTLIALIKGEK